MTLQPAGGVFRPDQVQTEFQALLLKLQLCLRVGGAVIYAVNVATGSQDGAMVETTVIRGRTSRY